MLDRAVFFAVRYQAGGRRSVFSRFATALPAE